MITQGRFISVEGIEGAGKTTAVQYIQDYFKKRNMIAHFTREPGGTPLAEAIRSLLLHQEDGQEKMQAETELLLMFAARAQHLANYIKPRLQRGQWVVSDRFIDASYAYQVGGRALSESLVRTLDEGIVQGCYPSLTILLDIAPDIGLARASARGHQQDRIESEQVEFFARVRDTYLARYQADQKRIKLINASGTPTEINQQIEQLLTTHLAGVL
ncbi:MAG TPA: dTMP kinase [Myxococcota bacterium]|nr:dTMP kinase [Myxococcota bacterium]